MICPFSQMVAFEYLVIISPPFQTLIVLERKQQKKAHLRASANREINKNVREQFRSSTRCF